MAKQNASLTSLLLFFWSIAEGSFFFVLPDALLAPLAAKYPHNWFKLVCICISGTLVGSLVPFLLAKYDPTAGYYLLHNIAFVSQAKIDRVASTLNDLGYLSFLLQPFSLIPLKAFVFEASKAKYSPYAICAMVALGRAVRNLLVAFAASRIGLKFAVQLQANRTGYLGIWIFFCACLVGSAMLSP
ncbi:MAG: hypothetical protein K2X29_01125 [Candidatus Obscuribacterales bacterium]|nr:hypothetical protein [Candidatus Obscuribacterales bacterium]